jgi:hypothetical protein
MGDALILILTVQLMAEAGVGGKETTLPLLAPCGWEPAR